MRPSNRIRQQVTRARYTRSAPNSPALNLLVNGPAAATGYGRPGWVQFKNRQTRDLFTWMGDDDPLNVGRAVSDLTPAITKATSLIVDQLMVNPWQVVRVSADTATRQVLPLPRWIADPQLVRPVWEDQARVAAPPPMLARLTRMELFSQLLTSALWRGMGWLCFQPSDPAAPLTSQPLAGSVRVLNPGNVVPNHDGTWRVSDGMNPDAVVNAAGLLEVGGVVYRLVPLRGLGPYSPDGVGVGVLQRHLGIIDHAASLQRYTESATNSGVPYGYLKATAPDLTQAEADAVRDDWMARHGGDRRSIAVLNATTDFTPLTMFSPHDAQLIEQKKSSLLDVALAFGVEPYQLGAPTDSGTYANVDARRIDAGQYGLAPWRMRTQQMMSGILPTNVLFEIDLRGSMQADHNARATFYASALKAGWMTVDEVRERELMPPLPAPDPVPAQLQLPPPPDTVPPTGQEDDDAAA